MKFIELCAGSAALSMHLLCGCRPPAAYVGAKTKYAKTILDLMGLERPEKLILVDPGPWGVVWEIIIHKCDKIIETMNSWSDLDDDVLYEICKDNFLNKSDVLYAASFIWLQSRVLRNMPVDARWKYTKLQRPHGNIRHPYQGRRVPTLKGTIKKLQAINNINWPETIVLNKAAEDVKIGDEKDTVVYIDPPYVNSSIFYSNTLSRQGVIDLAVKWDEAGAKVYRSSEPKAPTS